MTNPAAGHPIRVVTLNVWGLPDLPFRRLTPARTERIRCIAEELGRQARNPTGWEVVLIQEAWMARDRAWLADCGYPYVLDLDDAWKVVDSGLLILSRHRIDPTASARIRFSVGGHLSRAFGDGEALARKGALLAKVMHPEIGPLWVGNTHLIARYPGTGDVYLKKRLIQLEELLDGVLSWSAGEPLILGGDFNFSPGSIEWIELRKRIPGFVEIPDAVDPLPFGHLATLEGEKLDHLLASPHFRTVHQGIVFDASVRLGERAMRVSDHVGLESHFRWQPPGRPLISDVEFASAFSEAGDLGG